MFVILTQSGVHAGVCLLGEGTTTQEAWEDAFGQKPWTPYVRQCATRAWVEEVDQKELENLRANT